MKKILLTGSGGFIGKNIKESYLCEKYDITSPRSFELNLLDTEQVDAFFNNRYFDVIIHAGCKPGHRNAKDTSNLFYSNVRMFENLVRHTNNFGKLINFGSGAIYNLAKDISNAKESDIFNEMSSDDHGFCKYIVAKRIEAINAQQKDDFKKVIDFNIFGIFGKYEDWEIRLPSNAICKAIYNLPITIRQDRKFSYLYVDDLIPILEYFIENNPKYNSYNICPTEKTSLVEIAKYIKDYSENDMEIKVAKNGNGLEYTGNNSRLLEEINDIKFTDLKLAIKDLYDYYQSIKEYIDKNLLLNDK